MAALPPQVNEFREFRQLVEIQGPFISSAILKDTFPQSFDKPADHSETLRATRLEWEEWHEHPAALHQRWIQHVISTVLGFQPANLATGQAIPQSMRVQIPETREYVAPSLLITTAEDEDLAGNHIPAEPLAPVLILAPGAMSRKGRTAAGASPAEPGAARSTNLGPVDRAIALLRGLRLPVGLVTDGERWTIVYAPAGESVTSTATWHAEMWMEEQLTFRAFRSLFGAHRWFNVEPARTLPKLLERSALNQAAVTTQLGRQVRQAIERLVLSLDRADQDKSRNLLAGIPEQRVYEGAIAVMMRLVFLFFAEERELLPANDELYAEAYAVSTIREQLQAAADSWGSEVLERRHDAWSRLLATFRAVHSGIFHHRLTLPAYGGELFDPDRYPFLAGRPDSTTWQDTEATPLPVDNRTVLEMLESLQILHERGSEPRQLTFRELDVPDIGHVYESLLDHTAKRARAVTLGLIGSDGEEPEIELSTLEEWRASGQLLPKLIEQTGKSENALRKALDIAEAAPDPRTRERLRTACRGDQAMLGRVLPFAGIVRNDPRGAPMVILRGSLFVTAGADRRSTGTHYTPTSLTEPIVRYTLEPLVYIGPAEGVARDEWKLRPARELLDLKVCDMACGSGAFLVAAARYLAARLQEAWEEAIERHPGVPGITPEGNESTGLAGEELIPAEPVEREAYALRLVAQRCLYGVDKNPLAAEMAKLSMWLLTLSKGKPFTFVDHAIKPGDSLIGMESQLLIDGHVPLGTDDKLRTISDLRQSIAVKRASDVRERREQEIMLKAVDKETRLLKAMADAFIGAKVHGVTEYGDIYTGDVETVERLARENTAGLTPFHWCLEFPEVFDGRSGFDGIIGNPPFMGGSRITGLLGGPYREFVIAHLAEKVRGNADYAAYFFLRARRLLRGDGLFGLLATNSIAQGETARVGLEPITQECVIIRAVSSRKWPGPANLEVSHVWAFRGIWAGPFILDDQLCAGITPVLSAKTKSLGSARPLRQNARVSFEGSKLIGIGFAVTVHEREQLIQANSNNIAVLFPYLNGEDITSRPDCSASRWVIDFRDWPLEKAEEFPECLDRVRTLVKPDRDRNNRPTRRDRWWQFAEIAPALYARITPLARVVVASRVSSHHVVVIAQARQVFSDRLIVFAYDKSSAFALLQSEIHNCWAHRPGTTTHETRNTYFPNIAFETFPFPTDLTTLEDIGERYHSYRAALMLERQFGLTKTYNLFHDRRCTDADIQTLRDLHIEMDHAVAKAYNWTFPLDHGFHPTKQGERFTISPHARQTVLDLLLQLNHERYAAEQAEAEEVAAKNKSSAKPRSKSTRKRTAAHAATPLLDAAEQQEEPGA